MKWGSHGIEYNEIMPLGYDLFRFKWNWATDSSKHSCYVYETVVCFQRDYNFTTPTFVLQTFKHAVSSDWLGDFIFKFYYFLPNGKENICIEVLQPKIKVIVCLTW